MFCCSQEHIRNDPLAIRALCSLITKGSNTASPTMVENKFLMVVLLCKPESSPLTGSLLQPDALFHHNRVFRLLFKKNTNLNGFTAGQRVIILVLMHFLLVTWPQFQLIHLICIYCAQKIFLNQDYRIFYQKTTMQRGAYLAPMGWVASWCTSFTH